MAKAWKRFRPVSEVLLTPQRNKELAVGCPACSSQEPTHVQIRAEAPAHVWRCSCGVHWYFILGLTVIYYGTTHATD